MILSIFLHLIGRQPKTKISANYYLFPDSHILYLVHTCQIYMKFTILQIGFITAALPLTLFFRAPKPVPVTAISTNDFLNSIGVNSAISSRGESLDKTIAAIKYTGIRWIRSGYEGNATDQDYQTLHREMGIKFSYGLMSGGTDLKRLLNLIPVSRCNV